MLRSDAEILKYIGDEVIFTWTVPRGARDARCLDLYFDLVGTLVPKWGGDPKTLDKYIREATG